jgi:adenosylcobalamin-dependent ribonucleoside-triphosphate reductase
MENARKFSRMGHERDYKDYKAVGTNPCSEQTLESYEMCCLVETFPTRHDGLKDYLRTLKFAYLYAKTVTLGNTHWVETNRVQLRNRRIGTSVSGVAQFIGEHGVGELKHWLNEGYDTIARYDETYSNWLAVPKSIKVTSVKPSGTVSLLPGVTPGMHYPISNYYTRRIRLSIHSDLTPYLSKAGYHIEPDVNDPDNTLVVEVPVKIENCRTLDDVSIWEQCELAAFMQEHWADNQVSCTVTFRPEEASQIENVLQYFQYRLKSISFLPKADSVYAQMPYEQISKDEYEKRVKNLKGLSIKTLSEKAEPDKFCDGDTCVM